MEPTVAAQHKAEVRKGERFEFGKNWSRFLSVLNDERIASAEGSLQKALGAERLDGKTFLDIGSGSGLFSLAARRLGAAVRSFDYDSYSVACTRELRRRYFPDDPNWTVEQGSVLDTQFLAGLGTFDIVYSWGVLHHTGAMWPALESVKRLPKIGGQLYIAIYNDLGVVTDQWRSVKQTYNRLPSMFRLPYALWIIWKHEREPILHHYHNKSLRTYLRGWKGSEQTVRGMNKWYDWIDWIGGYPYETATLEQIADFFGKDGFSLRWVESRAHGTGCNEFVFQRIAELGVAIDSPLPRSRLLVRQFGRMVTGPFRRLPEGYLANIPRDLSDGSQGSLILFRGGELAGVAPAGSEANTIIVAPPECSEEQVASARLDVVRGRIQPFPSILQKYSGNMFGAHVPALKDLTDNSNSNQDDSPVFIFEDKRQLAMPHSIHDDIVRYGEGRFSHWDDTLLFATSDNSDPRTNGRVYEIVISERNRSGN